MYISVAAEDRETNKDQLLTLSNLGSLSASVDIESLLATSQLDKKGLKNTISFN